MRGHEEGVSLIELLAAVFLISIAIVPMLELYPNTLGIQRETEYDVVLSATAVRKMEELITLHRAVFWSKKFYLHQEVAGMAGNWQSREAIPDAGENSTTQKGAFAQPAGTFVLFRPGVSNSTTGTPGATPQGFGWWSNTALTRTFAAGAWSLSLRRDADGNSASSSARFHVRVYRVPQNTSTAGAVELFNTTGPNFTYSSTAATGTWSTTSVGPFTLTNQYLLVEVWLEAVTTSASTRSLWFVVEGSALADASRSQFLTTPTATLPVSGSGTCTDLPNCRLVWTIATELSSATSGVGQLDTLNIVACQDANGNSACDTAERQVRYDAKITTRP